MTFQELAKMGLLYDFYGKLLSKRQREVLALYYEENLSLGEISQEFNISRQGVYDALKHGGEALVEYEESLGLVERFKEKEKFLSEIRETINLLLNDTDALCKEELVTGLLKIRTIVEDLDG